MRFACPHCNTHLQAEAALAGKQIKCPACSQKLTIPEGFDEEPSSDEGADGGDTAGVPAEGAAGSGELTSSSASAGWTDLANVPMWQSLLIGIGGTIIWFILMILLQAPQDTPTGDLTGAQRFSVLFLERSWVQYVTTFLMFWSLGILVLKAMKLRKQQRAMLLEILPHDISDEITPENTPDFYQHVTGLPERVRDTFMVNRVRRGLEYFWVRRNNPEVAAMMSSQSDIDASAISGSYTIIKVFIWAIPIMGFIGTVLGIGAAIGNISGALEGAEDTAVLFESLQKVTGGLGTAFDTTLVALVMSIFVSIPASAMQKNEEILNQVDDYCNENLLKRLNDGGAGVGGSGADSGDMVQRIGDAIARNQKDMIAKFEDMYAGNAEAQAEQIAAFKKASSVLEEQTRELEQRAKQNQMLVDEHFTTLIDKVQKDATKTIGTLAEGIGNLNEVLSDLNGKTVSVEKKKGWFGR